MSERVVIVGAGLAAVRASEALRSNGYDGGITVLGDEPHLPYDRPQLSKDLLVGKADAQSVAFREQSHYDALQIELILGSAASGLDLERGVVRHAGGEVPYDELIIATGSRPRSLDLALPKHGVSLLRTLDDSQQIRSQFEKGGRVVVAGAGFIGAEVASSARAMGLEATIVEMQPMPMVRAVGERVAQAFIEMHRTNGTDLRCGVHITEAVGTDHLERIRLSDGTELACDQLVLGLGVVPNVEWLAGSGLPIEDGLTCDAQLCAGPPNVHAVGDVANWPNALVGYRMRAQQWMVAVEQARYVARGIAEHTFDKPFTSSNYFWSHQYGAHFQFAGNPRASEVQVVEGSLDGDSFLVAYGEADRLVGTLAKNASQSFVKAKILIEKQAPFAAALTIAA